ncbi:putative pilus assembly protein PilX [Moraxella macacae 0408225]|uniref:Putative pilus assembly protein PilX n=1 Tax=Moraxella macacae 0408225 TaxID=1230338 RepID=L2F6G2_9GAMM|nr:hypothetical protein [Moraxella macacae]ELA08612.1 putative pilus assembly protein PilX [Moraxella macacae 0408225]
MQILTHSPPCQSLTPDRVAPNHAQKGATLIVVLLFLILVMIAGAMSVKRSTTDLKLATSDQINTMLLQSADNANQKLETVITDYPKSVENRLGMFGYFMQRPETVGDEFIYCFHPDNAKVNTVTGGFIRLKNGGIRGKEQICKPDKADSFVNDRKISMVQVSVTRADVAADPNAEDFGSLTEGRDTNGYQGAVEKTKFDIRPTSLMPSYSDPDTCLKKSVVGSDNIVSCLTGKSVPHKTLYQQAVVEENTCTDLYRRYGGAGASKLC